MPRRTQIVVATAAAVGVALSVALQLLGTFIDCWSGPPRGTGGSCPREINALLAIGVGFFAALLAYLFTSGRRGRT